MVNQESKRTPLYLRHIELSGKLVDFAGWQLPVRYEGVVAEHVAVREKAGIFDVSHMGEIFVKGPEAEAALNDLTCNDVSKLYNGKAIYSAITNERGGVVDDIIIYRYSSTKYLVCVNASNAEKDFEWFTKYNKRDAEFVNESANYGQIAIQGPLSEKILSEIHGGESCGELEYFHFKDMDLHGVPVIVARTGYTGEDGFEIFTPSNETPKVWDALLKVGTPLGLKPCGLGARDSLRLEACYSLHGHELSEDFSAIESGIGFVVKFDKGQYTGRDVLLQHKEKGAPRALIGFFVDEPGIAREGSKVCDENGNEIGIVTSGTLTPTLNRALGLAMVKSEYSKLNTPLLIDVRGKQLKAHVESKPFYKRSK